MTKNNLYLKAKLGLLTLILSLLGLSVGCKNTDQQGVASGGGGYAQSGTAQILEYAKNHLADAIENTPEIFFQEFPSEYDKHVMAQIIRELKFLPTERRQRDGQYLKLDYNKKNRSLIATYDFYVVYNVGSIIEFIEDGIFKDDSKVQTMIQAMQRDILHEFSHLLEIGNTGQTDTTSQIFANSFLEAISDIKFQCNSTEFTIKFWPYAKTLEISKDIPPSLWMKEDMDKFFFSSDLYQFVTGRPVFESDNDGTPYFVLAKSGAARTPFIHYISDLKNEKGNLLFSESGTDSVGLMVYDYEKKEWVDEDWIASVSAKSELSFEKNYQRATIVNQLTVIDTESNRTISDGVVYNEFTTKEIAEVIEFTECKRLPSESFSITTYPLTTFINNQVTSHKDPKVDLIYDALYAEKD